MVIICHIHTKCSWQLQATCGNAGWDKSKMLLAVGEI